MLKVKEQQQGRLQFCAHPLSDNGQELRDRDLGHPTINRTTYVRTWGFLWKTLQQILQKCTIVLGYNQNLQFFNPH